MKLGRALCYQPRPWNQPFEEVSSMCKVPGEKPPVKYVAYCGCGYVESGNDLLELIRVVRDDGVLGESVAIWDGAEMVAFIDVDNKAHLLFPILLPFPKRGGRSA
jgi:hypothetical protein